MTRAEVQGNFYEILRVDRDAPPAVIRESYRRLMQHSGNHPDLGGDTGTAALINKAYSVLNNPEQRRDYDIRLDILQRVTAGIAVAPVRKPLDPSFDCLFCEQPHGAVCQDEPGVGCEVCGSPLQSVADMRMDSADNRAVHRLDKQVELTFFTHWQQPAGFAAQTEDISPQGLRMVTRGAIRSGQRIRLVSNILEAVGDITHCVPRHTRWRTENVAGVAFLTLRLLRSVGGFVSRHA
jgi:hypothetical protein